MLTMRSVYLNLLSVAAVELDHCSTLNSFPDISSTNRLFAGPRTTRREISASDGMCRGAEPELSYPGGQRVTSVVTSRKSRAKDSKGSIRAVGEPI